jgi:hypothetical protein
MMANDRRRAPAVIDPGWRRREWARRDRTPHQASIGAAAACDASPGSSNGTDHVVTLVFTARGRPKRQRCGQLRRRRPRGVQQRPGVVSDLRRSESRDPATRLDVDRGDRRLVFAFPDTDALLAPDGDDVTLAGPVAIGVTKQGQPPACGLATASCAAQSGLIACVDTFYANDGACGTAVPNVTFPSFTALPPPNDFQADCFRRSRPARRRRRPSAARWMPLETPSSR